MLGRRELNNHDRVFLKLITSCKFQFDFSSGLHFFINDSRLSIYERAGLNVNGFNRDSIRHQRNQLRQILILVNFNFERLRFLNGTRHLESVVGQPTGRSLTQGIKLLAPVEEPVFVSGGKRRVAGATLDLPGSAVAKLVWIQQVASGGRLEDFGGVHEDVVHAVVQITWEEHFDVAILF